MLIFLSPRSGEGRLLETILKAERGAAPAGGARNPALGRSRDPTGGHYDPSARSSLDRAVSGLLGAKARRGDEPAAPKPPERRDVDLEARTRDRKSPRRSAERRRALRTGRARRKVRTDKWRLSAPRPPLFFRGRLPVPLFRGAAKFLAKLGRSPRRENDGACLHDTSKPDR